MAVMEGGINAALRATPPRTMVAAAKGVVNAWVEVVVGLGHLQGRVHRVGRVEHKQRLVDGVLIDPQQHLVFEALLFINTSAVGRRGVGRASARGIVGLEKRRAA